MANNFGVTFKITRQFFDRQALVTPIERAAKRNLSKAGAFIRKRARSSIRKRKKVSAAGSPPSSHTSDKVVTIRNILFGYEQANQSVVIGPVKLRGRVRVPGAPVPSRLEFGGTHKVQRFSGRGVRRKQRAVQRATYRPRPFMGPALEKEVAAGTIPSMWAGSVRS